MVKAATLLRIWIEAFDKSTTTFDKATLKKSFLGGGDARKSPLPEISQIGLNARTIN
ncbi:hypothetical protein D3C80_1122820 [compost metagenome]